LTTRIEHTSLANAAAIPFPAKAMKATLALEALSFFMADVQAGIGPFIGVFLLDRGWRADEIGSVMTLAGLAAMVATPLAGAVVDATRSKRSLIVAATLATTLASLALVYTRSYAGVAGSQIVAAVSASVLLPALAGVTLGMVRASGFDRQFARMANHAGNVAGAALAGWFGWHYGFNAVFALAAIFAVLAVVSVLLIPAQAIDYASARGLDGDQAQRQAAQPRSPGRLRSLFVNRPLALLGASLALFTSAMQRCCRFTAWASWRPIAAIPAPLRRKPS
jgi:predicted MFS family arabinose efflux permease